MEWIIRFNGLQLVSNCQPHSVYGNTIVFADGSTFNVSTSALLKVHQGVNVELLSEHDLRRVADDAMSSHDRPIIDMIDHGGGTCEVSSHEGRFAITGYGKMVVDITGQTGIQFGSGNHMEIRFD